jgi:hypothetical protein
VSAPDFEGVCVAHELLSGYTATRPKRKFVGSFVCSCGHFESEVENVPYQTLHAAHLSAALHAEVARWLAGEGLEVISGVRAWCAINEIAAPPLDWAGLGLFLGRREAAALAALATTTREDPR